MSISFARIRRGVAYSRQELAKLWGYRSYYAIARGVVTPKYDNKIVLFVTEVKQASATKYVDRLVADSLDWEGPNDHYAEERMCDAKKGGDEIHLLYRERHHRDFTYFGQLELVSKNLFADRPSRFKFRVL